MTGDGRPLRLVTFGGGTGLPILLTGLRDRRDTVVTAVVSVADDGGSSGRLRREFAVAPPGDLRNCLIALARDRGLAHVFAHRFRSLGPLDGHVVGNLILASLFEDCEDLPAAVARASLMLRVAGVVLPAACAAQTLCLRTRSGIELHGESLAASQLGALASVSAAGPPVPAPAGVFSALDAADAVVLSAGSLFTSTIAALLGAGTREALSRFDGPVLYVANLQTEEGETAGMTLADHVRTIAAHAGPRVTDVLVPAEPLPGSRDARRSSVELDRRALERLGVAIHRAGLLPPSVVDPVHHDPQRVACGVLAALRQRDAQRARPRTPEPPSRSAVSP